MKLIIKQFLKGKTLRYISNESEVPYQVIRDMAANKYKKWDSDNLEKIAVVLGVKPKQLISN